MFKKVDVNEATLEGKVVSDLSYYYTSRDVKYYKFYISLKRLSEVEDIIPVVISEIIMEKYNVKITNGDYVSVSGEYRSYNSQGRLYLFLKAKAIASYGKIKTLNEDTNRIYLGGHICKAEPLRITPLGKRIVEIMVAVNRRNGLTSYIPCILWGLSDQKAAEYAKVGNEVSIEGRIQSRKYTKVLPDGNSEERVAYEVSIMKYM